MGDTQLKNSFQCNKLSENAFISNVQSFDAPSKQIFLIMIQQLQREFHISAGSIFKIKMSIDTFLKVFDLTDNNSISSKLYATSI